MDREISKSRQRRESAMRAARILLPLAVAAAIIWWALSAVSRRTADASTLHLAQADRGDITVTVAASGRVVPAYEEVINSPVASRITAVRHRAGDIVEAGTPLLGLDLEATQVACRKMADQLQMKQLELHRQLANDRTALSQIDMEIKVGDMNVRRLEAELANERYLDSIGSGTTDKVRQAEFTLRSAELELEQLRRRRVNEEDVRRAAADVVRLEIRILEKEYALAARTLDAADIRAPRRGTVTRISSTIGAQVAQGEAVAAVADLDHFKVEAEASDTYARSLRPGASATVRVGTVDLPATIASVAPASTSGVIAFSVSLDCDSAPSLRSGLRPDVYVHNGLKSGVVRIPNGAYYRGPGPCRLYVLAQGGRSLILRDLHLGTASMDHVEVISGLEPGETIATDDPSRFAGAPRVEINE